MTALERARMALEGLSVGDAFGERYFIRPDIAHRKIEERQLPAEPVWRYTDDTEMALALFEVLRDRGHVDQDALAERFARRYADDPHRGYGAGAHQLLADIGAGCRWQLAAAELFGGSGSYGNGGAMRVAPLGAYFADDYPRCAEEAAKSAAVTHANPEGQAGAVAVAIAAAWAWRNRDARPVDVDGLWQAVLEHTPAGRTRDGIERAREILPRDYPVARAVDELGNGSRVSAQDTVPFCLWQIARHPTSFEDAMWETVAGMGDRDTTCAIVGGVVALSAGPNPIPADWLEAREPLPL